MVIIKMNARQIEYGIDDYWKVIVKRKKFIISLFIVSVVITAVVSILMPKIYRAEFIVKVGTGHAASSSSPERINTDGVMEIIGKPNNGKTGKIFAEKAPSIKVLKVAKLKGFADKLIITVESEDVGSMETAIVKFIDHINNHPLIKKPADEERTAIEKRLKDIPGLIREYNAFAQMYDERLKKRELSVINFVPAELKEKAIGLDNERRYLEDVMKNIAGVTPIDKPYISKTPVSPDIKKNIILAGIISFFAGVFLSFLLEYKDLKQKSS